MKTTLLPKRWRRLLWLALLPSLLIVQDAVGQARSGSARAKSKEKTEQKSADQRARSQTRSGTTTRRGSTATRSRSVDRSREADRTRANDRTDDRARDRARNNDRQADRAVSSQRSRQTDQARQAQRTPDRARDGVNLVRREGDRSGYNRGRNTYTPNHYRHDYDYTTRYYRSGYGSRAHYRRPYGSPYYHARFDWYYSGWSSRYTYKQVVWLDVGWGHRHREMKLDVRTELRQKVRRKRNGRVEIEFDVEKMWVYADGRFVGEIRNIPNRLGRIKATVHRDGYIDFDRMVFLIGDPYSGFELINTRYYNDGYILDRYQRSHGVRVGELDFRRRKVVNRGESYFFDPYDFEGYVPIGLIPEDEYWGFEVAAGWYDGHAYDDYGYYDSGYYGGYGQDGYYRPNQGYQTRSNQGTPRGNIGRGSTATQSRAPQPRGTGRAQPFRKQGEQTIRTQRGAQIKIKREVEIEKIGANRP